jgi:hypothetical protein
MDFARACTMRCVLLLLVASIGLCRYEPAAAQNALFYDGFRSAPLNAAIWVPSHEVYKDPKVPLDDRVFYSPEAISVDKGLKLVLRQRTAADDQTEVPFRYVSGRIQSRLTYLFGISNSLRGCPPGADCGPLSGSVRRRPRR